MRTLSLSILALVLTGSASAQIVGGVTGAVGGTVNGAVGATVDPPRTMPSAAATVDRATAAPSRVRTPEGPTVNVRAGVSTRVDRGTRCYYADDYYDPIYRDGTYYCETRTSGAGAGASVATRPPQQ